LTDFEDTKPRKWYKPSAVNNRDFRGLIKDIHYNVPPSIQPLFLSRLEILGEDIKRLVKWTMPVSSVFSGHPYPSEYFITLA